MSRESSRFSENHTPVAVGPYFTVAFLYQICTSFGPVNVRNVELWIVALYTVSQKTSDFWFAITVTHVNRF